MKTEISILISKLEHILTTYKNNTAENYINSDEIDNINVAFSDIEKNVNRLRKKLYKANKNPNPNVHHSLINETTNYINKFPNTFTEMLENSLKNDIEFSNNVLNRINSIFKEIKTLPSKDFPNITKISQTKLLGSLDNETIQTVNNINLSDPLSFKKILFLLFKNINTNHYTLPETALINPTVTVDVYSHIITAEGLANMMDIDRIMRFNSILSEVPKIKNLYSFKVKHILNNKKDTGSVAIGFMLKDYSMLLTPYGLYRIKGTSYTSVFSLDKEKSLHEQLKDTEIKKLHEILNTEYPKNKVQNKIICEMILSAFNRRLNISKTILKYSTI